MGAAGILGVLLVSMGCLCLLGACIAACKLLDALGDFDKRDGR